MEIDELKAREFWSKPPIERSQIAAERLKHCMADFQVTAEQVAGYTRMDLPRLQAILGGEVVMGIDEFMDIYHSIPDANESRIAADNLYHHHMIGALKKIAWQKDGWNGESTKGLPERLVRRFLHHLRSVKDSHLRGWLLAVTDDGEIKMSRGEQTLLLSWDAIRPQVDCHDITMPFTKENFAGMMELMAIGGGWSETP
jgi:hypothetical protein